MTDTPPPAAPQEAPQPAAAPLSAAQQGAAQQGAAQLQIPENGAQAPQTPPAPDFGELLGPSFRGKTAEQVRQQLANATANAQKAREFDKLQDAQKSDQERAAEALAAAQQAAATAQLEAMRYRAAAEAKIGAEYVGLIGGTDEESIRANAAQLGTLAQAAAQAETLAARVMQLEGAQGEGGTPTPQPPAPSQMPSITDLRPGATPAEKKGPNDAYPSSWLPQKK